MLEIVELVSAASLSELGAAELVAGLLRPTSGGAFLYGLLTHPCDHHPQSRWCSPRRAAQQTPRMRFDAAASGGLFLLHRAASSVGALLWIGACCCQPLRLEPRLPAQRRGRRGDGSGQSRFAGRLGSPCRLVCAWPVLTAGNEERPS